MSFPRWITWVMPAALCVLFLTPRAHAEHFDVFILIGQSNMDGRGQAKDLVGPLEKYSRPQSDVKIDYSCSDLRGPALSSAGWQPLSPGWSVPANRGGPDFKLPSQTFGLEVGFGRAIADAMPGHHVALIKFSEGGTNLRIDWNPDIRHRLWDQSRAFIHQALQDLTAHGDTYAIDGIIWHQGESDASLPPGHYAPMLASFITRLRADLGMPDLPFVVGEVFDNHHRDNVRQGQRDVTHMLPHVYFASSAGLVTRDRGTHFNAASQIEMGQRLAAAFLNKTPATQPVTPSTAPSDATLDTTETPIAAPATQPATVP
ncbi:MAG: sialate O-acetylesterase [Tepidisphaeraceae bacterium]